MDGIEIRKGDWMMTYRGRRFWPLDPRPEEVDLTDIAWALSQQCRYNGHGRFFYSVAEHCVLLARHFGYTENGKMALLHDASEAYIGDCIRPLKRCLPQFIEIERLVEGAIADRFGLPLLSQAVHEADAAILNDERRILFDDELCELNGWQATRPLGVQLRLWPSSRAFAEFMTLAEELGIK